MTTTISISTGPITASRTFADDAKAQAALLRFYTAYRIGAEDLTPRQKLDAVVDWFVDLVVGASVQAHIDGERVISMASLEEAARVIYDFKRGEPQEQGAK